MNSADSFWEERLRDAGVRVRRDANGGGIALALRNAREGEWMLAKEFGKAAVVGGGTFLGGLGLGQAAAALTAGGYSSAMHLAPFWGAVIVAGSAHLAHLAVMNTAQDNWLRRPHPMESLGYSLSSFAIFSALGGRTASVLPGDLLQIGPYAHESIKAPTLETSEAVNRQFKYADGEQIKKIQSIGWRRGCHSCGSKWSNYFRGSFIADHQPANKLVKLEAQQKQTVLGRTLTFLGITQSSVSEQVFLPQCRPCAQKQSVAAREFSKDTKNRAIRLHCSPRLYHATGALLGLFIYQFSIDHVQLARLERKE